MNKLQKLFESNIKYNIFCYGSRYQFLFKIYLKNHDTYSLGYHKNLESGVNWLWEEAKKHYPKAECFKEERKHE